MNRFPRVLGVRNGYDPDQVDALVRRIEGTLGRGSLEGEPITADEIRDARFRTKLGGYNEMAVDFALEAFIVAIETRLAGGAGPAPRPRPRPEVPSYAPVDESVGAGDPSSTGEDTRPDEPQDPAAGEVLTDRPETSATSEEHAARIERAAFRAGRLGMGYNEDQVDAFLDRVVATLRGTTDQPVTPGDVRAARFATVMLKPGYAVNEVDEFLTDLAGVLEAHLDR